MPPVLRHRGFFVAAPLRGWNACSSRAQQGIHTLKQQVTEHQTKFVQATQELARLTSELGAARRELAQIEQLRRQLNAASEKLAAAQSERDAAKLEAAARRRSRGRTHR